jgi:hypothetical protein
MSDQVFPVMFTAAVGRHEDSAQTEKNGRVISRRLDKRPSAMPGSLYHAGGKGGKLWSEPVNNNLTHRAVTVLEAVLSSETHSSWCCLSD